MTEKPRTLPVSKRGLNFEMLMWYFTRLSALAMYGLILFAIIGALWMGARTQMNLADIMRWGFMPNGTHVQNSDIPDLAPWVIPFWKLVASALLMLATAHGVHGLVVIADDYIAKHGGRQVVRLISIVFMLSMIGIGLYVIWTS
jgi:succinate dehydrogenase hydrophobic anchor subunit